MIYLFVYFLVLIISLPIKNYKIDQSNTFDLNRNEVNIMYKIIGEFSFIIVNLILIVFAGIRYNVGTDYSVYSQIQIPEVLSGINDRVEFLYRLLIKLGFFFAHDENYIWIFILTHVLIIVPILVLYKKESYNFSFSVFIFLFSGFLNNSFNMMRESIAISIISFSCLFLFKRKYIYFFIFIGIASLFHKSSILFILLYFLYIYSDRIEPIKFNSLLLILLILQNLIKDVLVQFSIKFNFYNSYWQNADFSSRPILWSYVLFNMFILVTVYIFKRKWVLNKIGEDDSRQNNFILYAQSLLLFFLLLSRSVPNSYRLAFTFWPLQGILVANIYSKLKNNNVKLIFSILILPAFIIFFVWTYVLNNGAGAGYYQTIFNY